MTQHFQETVAAWQRFTTPEEARAAIHPTGRDEAAYDASGRNAADHVVAALPPAHYPRIADFGCGDGRVLKHLVGRGYTKLVGVDVSLEMLARAAVYVGEPPAGVDLSFHASDGRALTTDWLDGVFSFAVFIHHTHADGVEMLKTLVGAVRVGGLLALQIPLYDVPREPANWTDVGVWTPGQFLTAIANAGCGVVSMHHNIGAFSYDAIGPMHHMLQVVERLR